LLLSAALGAACALLPVPPLVAGVIAPIVFLVAAYVTHALPREVLIELTRRGAPA
jgi:hypothetical protein